MSTLSGVRSASLFQAVAATLSGTRDRLRGEDLALHGAAVTFYAGVALVPSLLVSLAVLSALLGDDALLRLGRSLASALPAQLGADDVALRVVQAGTGVGVLGAAVAALPATLYGEGLRRSFIVLAGAPDESFTGWRGRLRIVPLLAVAPGLLLGVLLITPVLAQRFADGDVGDWVFGVWFALTVDWLALWVALAYVYAAVGPHRPSWRAVIWGSGVTAAFTSGFLQGFVLFLSLPIDLGAPLGGLTTVGAVVSLGFWLWLLHVLTLFGYVATLVVDERPWDRQGPRQGPRQRDRHEDSQGQPAR